MSFWSSQPTEAHSRHHESTYPPIRKVSQALDETSRRRTTMSNHSAEDTIRRVLEHHPIGLHCRQPGIFCRHPRIDPISQNRIFVKQATSRRATCKDEGFLVFVWVWVITSACGCWHFAVSSGENLGTRRIGDSPVGMLLSANAFRAWPTAADIPATSTE